MPASAAPCGYSDAEAQEAMKGAQETTIHQQRRPSWLCKRTGGSPPVEAAAAASRGLHSVRLLAACRQQAQSSDTGSVLILADICVPDTKCHRRKPTVAIYDAEEIHDEIEDSLSC
ncbi:A Disintegrin And Metalloproteinase With Thrombospondin Motifs 14 [Manis pentadactyla]|nr:A Disintegrin And Metalloproteinase With Thrombospondin Motifs 14 [Manis pentadactyla]